MAKKILEKPDASKTKKDKKKKDKKKKKKKRSSSSSSSDYSLSEEEGPTPEELQLQLGLRTKDIKLNAGKMMRYEDMTPVAGICIRMLIEFDSEQLPM